VVAQMFDFVDYLQAPFVLTIGAVSREVSTKQNPRFKFLIQNGAFVIAGFCVYTK